MVVCAGNGLFTPWSGWAAGAGGFGAPPFMPPPSAAWMGPGVAGLFPGTNPPTAVSSGQPAARKGKMTKAAAAQQRLNQQQLQNGGARCYKMLVARVALGKQGTGQSGMRKPPEVGAGTNNPFKLPRLFSVYMLWFSVRMSCAQSALRDQAEYGTM